MDVDWDAGTVLYAFGAFLGVVTIAYFGRSLIFDLSPTVKALLLLAGSGAGLLTAQYQPRKPFSSAFNVLAVTAYLVFLAYTTLRFSFSTEETFALLAASSAVFLALGYLVREHGFTLDPGRARKALLVLVAVGVVLTAFDVLGPQPTYDVALNDTVTVETGPQVVLGTVTVENPFLLSRDIDVPRFEGCLYTPERERLFIDTAPTGEVLVGPLPGGATRMYTLEGRVPMERPRDADADPVPVVTGTLPVERGEDCPASADTPKIVVTGGDGAVPRPP